jgi:hypothetical protein
MTINYLKAGVAALSLICITVLMVTNSVAHDAGFGLIGSIVGYAIGNGIATRQDVPVSPLFYRSKTTEPVTTQEGNSTNG